MVPAHEVRGMKLSDYWIAEISTNMRNIGGFGETMEDAIEDCLVNLASLGLNARNVEIGI